MGGRHGAALFCVANCDFGFAANCAGAANCASTSMVHIAAAEIDHVNRRHIDRPVANRYY